MTNYIEINVRAYIVVQDLVGIDLETTEQMSNKH